MWPIAAAQLLYYLIKIYVSVGLFWPGREKRMTLSQMPQIVHIS